MGHRSSHFSREELDEYVDLVYLTRGEILRVFDKFSRIDPIRIGQNRNAKIPCDRIVAATEELRLNPFGDRICQVSRGHQNCTKSEIINQTFTHDFVYDLSLNDVNKGI